VFLPQQVRTSGKRIAQRRKRKTECKKVEELGPVKQEKEKKKEVFSLHMLKQGVWQSWSRELVCFLKSLIFLSITLQ